MKDILVLISICTIIMICILALDEAHAEQTDTYTVYVWNDTPYDGNPIVLGKFANCDQGRAMAENIYLEHKAMHCITPDLTPPGGIKK